MEVEVVFASSLSSAAGIGCWDLQTGNQLIHYKNCCSPPHGLTPVGPRFLASPQVEPASGSIHYWSWHKPQVELKSFPPRQIKSLVANSQGTFIFGGSVSGEIYFWEVASGRMLWKWHAHYRAVTNLVLCEDQSLLISGSEDGSVKVCSLVTVFDGSYEGGNLYIHNFLEHNSAVTDIAVGYGGSNAILVSSFEDRSCKVWSLSTGQLLRRFVFPSEINAVALDPGESVFYAGGSDGKIYIAALNAESPADSFYGTHIIGALSEQSTSGVTCLSFCADGVSLVSGSEDGLIRVWDTRSLNIVRMFRHSKGPVNNILVLTLPANFWKSQGSGGKKHSLSLPSPLQKYQSQTAARSVTVVIGSQPIDPLPLIVPNLTEEVMNGQINEMQQRGSAAAAEMENERQKADCKRLTEVSRKWKTAFESTYKLFVDEVLDGDESRKRSRNCL